MNYRNGFLGLILAVILFGAPLAVAQQYGPTVDHVNSPVFFRGNEETPSLPQAPLNIPASAVNVTIDGTMSPGEWTDAAYFDISLTPYSSSFPPGSSKIWIKNDRCFLFLASEINYNFPAAWPGPHDAPNTEIWFDRNMNAQWNAPPTQDGNLAIPGPYTPTQAAFGYYPFTPPFPTAWASSVTGSMRYHRPFSATSSSGYPGEPVSNSVVEFVRFHDSNAQRYIIEAKIRFDVPPLSFTAGVPFRMRIHNYLKIVNVVGQINGQWPTVTSSYFFSVPPSASILEQATLAVIPPAPDVYDVTNVQLLDNPLYGAKIYNTGLSASFSMLVSPNPPPQTVPYIINVYGPYPSSALFTSISGSAVATATGVIQVPFPVNIPPGFYTIEVVVDDPGPCGIEKRTIRSNTLVLGIGQNPCVVWPGETNKDGIVNFGDRKALNDYIHDANLNPAALTGPGRLPPNFPAPLSEVEWIAQPAIPWQTPEGCDMDTDGNGLVNNFDYIAMKFNWMKWNSSYVPKDRDAFSPRNFDMDQNFPNPFNPTTSIRYSVPERTHVVLTINDILGREVVKLVNATVDPGVHTAEFDAKEYNSGNYIATVSMVGIESGLTFTKTIKMTLAK